MLLWLIYQHMFNLGLYLRMIGYYFQLDLKNTACLNSFLTKYIPHNRHFWSSATCHFILLGACIPPYHHSYISTKQREYLMLKYDSSCGYEMKQKQSNMDEFFTEYLHRRQSCYKLTLQRFKASFFVNTILHMVLS